MPLIVPAGTKGAGFTPAPAGQHIAVCSGVVDLGMQETAYGFKHKVYIQWQLPAVPVEWQDKEGKPQKGFATVGNFYTLSMNEKGNLRQMLEAWRAKPYAEDEAARVDLFSIVGRACQVTVTHSQKGDRVYANVRAVAPLLAGIPVPTLSGEPLIFSKADGKCFDKLPEWLQKKIINNPPPQSPAPAQREPAGEMPGADDDIPF